MKSILLICLTTLVIASCCSVIATDDANKSLPVQIRKSDDIALDEYCDGGIIIENPRGQNVTYKWSHTDTLTHYQASQLCSGLYKITVTKGNQTRVSQVIIN